MDVLEEIDCNDLKGALLTIATKQFEPFMLVRKDGSENHATAGIDFEFVKMLAQGMNFKYRYIVPNDNKWGDLDDNNTWNGIIGLLYRQIADAGAAGLGINLPRSQAVPFTEPYHFEQISFVNKRSPERSKAFAALYPFTLSVWVCILAALLACTTIVYCMEVINAQLCQSERNIKLADTFWYFFGSLVGKSGDGRLFQSQSSTIFLSVWWISVTTILAFYGSLLTSFITYPGSEPQIDTFERLADAVDKRQMEAASIAGSVPYSVIKSEGSSVLKSLNSSVRNSNILRSIPEGVREAMQKNAAFIFTKTAIESEVYKSHLEENLFISEDSMYTALGGMALSAKFKKCSRKINQYIKRFLSMGLFNKWKKDLLDVRKRHSSEKEAKPLSLSDLQGPFYMLLIGHIIAIIVFFIERFSLLINYVT